MDTIYGLLGMIAWALGTITLAATVTYVVIRLFPDKKQVVLGLEEEKSSVAPLTTTSPRPRKRKRRH